MVVKRLGQADWRFGNARDRTKPLLHAIELLLHVTDVAQVFIEDHAVGCAERTLEAAGLGADRIEQALFLFEAGRTLIGGEP